MRSTHLPTIANVRFLVGAVGERFEWWRTQFTRESSHRSLEFLFPKTAMRAALESVTDAARRKHDEALGPRSFHLFRLPIHLEDRLAGWLAKPENALPWPPATEDLVVAQLEATAGRVGPTAGGPLCLGKPDRLNHETTFKELASAYLQAARSTSRVAVFPYFED